MTRKSRDTSGTENSAARPSAPAEIDERGLRILQTPLVFPADALAPVPSGITPDHLLLASVRGSDLILTLPCPVQATYSDTVQLIVQGQLLGGEILVDDYLPDLDIPLTLTADQRLTEGRYTLNYALIYRSGEGLQEPGPAGQQFIVDYTAPAGAPIRPPAFAADVVSEGVTPERLSIDAEGNAYLPASIATYFGQIVGDTLVGYIDGVPATDSYEATAADEGKDIELRFTRAALEAAQDGVHDFTFDIVDRAGNRSVRSNAVSLTIRMHALIPNPLPARVPAATDGLVDHDDADRPDGVQVDIPANSLVLPGDTVVLTWANYTSQPYPIVAGSENSDPLLSLFVPYADVYKAWFATSADSDARVATDVSYVILRGNLVAGKPDAATVVEVNLFVPGGIDPDPEPGHGALQPPTVYSADGSENFIPIAEQQRDGLVVVAWKPAIPGRKVFILGDILTIRFGSTTLTPSRVIDADDVAAAAPLSIVLPKEAIGTEPTGPVEVSYSIERPLAAGGSNTATSPLRMVTLEDQTDLPGEGDLAEGWFPEMNVYLTLGPKEIKGGTVFMGDYTDRRAGDRIRFEFQLVAGNAHRNDEIPIAERFHGGEIILAADGDPVEYLILESFLNYRDLPPEQMHIHATYHASRGMSSEVHSPSSMVYLDCRGAIPPLEIDTTPVQILGTATFKREASNGEPPYKYTSSMPGIVAVPDETVGRIEGVTDGKAEITASDAAGSFKSYSVTVVGNTPFFIDPSDVQIVGTGTFKRDAKGGVPPYRYTSSDPGVAAVPQPYEGRVIGVSDGEATITASDNGPGTGKYLIFVTGNTPFDIDDTLVEISGTGNPYARRKGGKKPYKYVSGDPNVVRVPDLYKGDIQGVSDGEATITASDANGSLASYRVVVTGNTLPFGISDDPVSITGTNTYDRSAYGGKRPYLYTSEVPTVAAVTDQELGTIQGVSDGKTTITASDANGELASYKVTVTGNTFPFGINGDPVSITGTDTYDRSAYGGRRPYSYTSGEPGIVRVIDQLQGTIQGVSDGETTITAKDTNQGLASYKVTVTGNTLPFGINGDPVSITGTNTYDRSAYGGERPYLYTPGEPGIVRVIDQLEGTIKGVSDGETTITASDANGKLASYKVTVTGNTLPFGISGDPVYITGTNTYDRSAYGGKRPYSYTSGEPGIVRVIDQLEGTIQGVSDGETTITASDANGKLASYEVTVTGNTLPFGISGDPVYITGTNTYDRSAYGGKRPYSYTSGEPGIVRVVDQLEGTIQGVSDGETTITAKDTNQGLASYKVTVTGNAQPFDIPTTLVTITGTETNLREATGGKPPYTYVSNDTSVVRVPDPHKGDIQGVDDGSTTITASDTNGSSKSYPVTVTGNAQPFDIPTTLVTITGTGTKSREATGGKPPYTYVSNDTRVVRVPDPHRGDIQGVDDGSTTITASDTNGSSKSYPVTVTGNAQPFDIPTTLVTITGTGTKSREATGGKPPYTYVSRDTSVVRVPDPHKGDIQGVDDGSTTITASDTNGSSKSYPVTVTGNTSDFYIGQAAMFLKVGGRDGRQAMGGKPPYKYVSGDLTVVSVGLNGDTLGIGAGVTSITASDADNNSGNYTVIVESSSPPLSISGPATVNENAAFTCTAQGGKPPYAFTSSNTAIATLTDNNGHGVGVSPGSCTITVTDQNAATAPHQLQVLSVRPPLSIDQTLMTLNGTIYRGPGLVPNPPSGAFETRLASGGSRPYTYRAQNAEYVDVDYASGRVTSLRSGSTRVIARDSDGQEVSYPVSVTNVQLVFGTGWHGTYTQCRQAAEAQGGHVPSLAEWAALRSCYNGVPGLGNTLGWASDSAGVGKRWAIVPDTGATQALVDIGIGGGAADGWGLKAV